MRRVHRSEETTGPEAGHGPGAGESSTAQVETVAGGWIVGALYKSDVFQGVICCRRFIYLGVLYTVYRNRNEL